MCDKFNSKYSLEIILTVCSPGFHPAGQTTNEIGQVHYLVNIVYVLAYLLHVDQYIEMLEPAEVFHLLIFQPT